MRRYKVAIVVCLCLVMGNSELWAANRKLIIIYDDSTNLTKCYVTVPKKTLSHDQKKDERIHWIAENGNGPYLVVFKDNSPCYDDALPGAENRLTFNVPRGVASAACIPRFDTAEGEYNYSIYKKDSKGDYLKCNDPMVIVTDGGAPLQASVQGIPISQGQQPAHQPPSSAFDETLQKVIIDEDCRSEDVAVTLSLSKHSKLQWFSRNYYYIKFKTPPPPTLTKPAKSVCRDAGGSDVAIFEIDATAHQSGLCYLNPNAVEGNGYQYEIRRNKNDADACGVLEVDVAP